LIQTANISISLFVTFTVFQHFFYWRRKTFLPAAWGAHIRFFGSLLFDKILDLTSTIIFSILIYGLAIEKTLFSLKNANSAARNRKRGSIFLGDWPKSASEKLLTRIVLRKWLA